MSTRATVICCVVAFICLILGAVALEFLPPIFGVTLVLIAAVLFAAVLAVHVQSGMDLLIEEEISHRKKVNEIYKLLKEQEQKNEEGE